MGAIRQNLLNKVWLKEVVSSKVMMITCETCCMIGGTTPRRKREHILNRNIEMDLRLKRYVYIEWTDLNKP
jgi:hypothetical protein